MVGVDHPLVKKTETLSRVTFNEGEIFFFWTDLFWRNSLLEVVLG